MALRWILTCSALVALAAQAQSPAYPVTPGKSFRDRSWAPTMMVIPGGSYMMGSPEAETTREGLSDKAAAWEHPQTHVAMPSLAVGQYDVTRADYARFVKAVHYAIPAGCTVIQNGKWVVNVPGKSFRDVGYPQTDRDPAACVSWEDANAYARWLSQATGHHYRLLHEVEWEYAARGGTTTARWWGDGREGLCAHANGGDLSLDKVLPDDPRTNRTCSDGFTFTNPVTHFAPNPFGLHDMIGNVWQWTDDCFSPTLPVNPKVLATTCDKRSIRGGSWHNAPDALRTASRFSLPHDMVASSLGFRVVRLPDNGTVQ
jgi:sulfatase modifying factor 1